jgi:hypothetical protein
VVEVKDRRRSVEAGVGRTGRSLPEDGHIRTGVQRMDMPKPGEAHRKLHKLAGRWEGTEIMHPSPWVRERAEALGRVENRISLDGFNVIQDYEQRMGDVVSFRGHGVFSWDMSQGCFTMHWWDNMGTPANVFKGDFRGDLLTLDSQSPMGHSRAITDLSRPNAYSFRMEFSQDGKQYVPFMEGSYTKKS